MGCALFEFIFVAQLSTQIISHNLETLVACLVNKKIQHHNKISNLMDILNLKGTFSSWPLKFFLYFLPKKKSILNYAQMQ
jgi:hypothetical protein